MLEAHLLAVIGNILNFEYLHRMVALNLGSIHKNGGDQSSCGYQFIFFGGGVNFLFCVCFDRVTMEEVQRQSVNLPLRALFHRPGSN